MDVSNMPVHNPICDGLYPVIAAPSFILFASVVCELGKGWPFPAFNALPDEFFIHNRTR